MRGGELISFLKSIPDGCRSVDILAAIRTSGRREPLIVIDLLALVTSLSGPSHECIYGCRNQFGWGYASDFCDKLLAAGARLVFFLDGKLPESEYVEWMARQDRLYGAFVGKLDALPVSGQINGNALKPGFIAALIAVARQRGVLITSFDVDCVRAVATFAGKNDAFAVFGRDFRYLIFEGRWRMWTNLWGQAMRAEEYDRGVLRTALGLEWGNMPFFAALACSDHPKNVPLEGYPAVAQKVRDLKLAVNTTNITVELCEQIYGKRDESLRDSLEQTVSSFNLNYTIIQPLIEPEMRHFPAHALRILHDIPNSILLPCLDLREADYSSIALQIFRRQVGLLFLHRPVMVYGEKLSAPVFIKPLHSLPFTIFAATPIFPPATLPVPNPHELYSLSQVGAAPSTTIRLQLLCWLVSDTLTVEQIFYIDPNYLLDVLTLYFLVENGLLDVVTADIILITIHDCLANIIERKLPLLVPRKANVVTCFKYTNFYAQIYTCAELVGLRLEVDSFFLSKFDGVYFNAIVDLLRCDYARMDATVDALDHLRIYARIGRRQF